MTADKAGSGTAVLSIGDIVIHWLRGGRFRLDGGAMFGPVPKPLWARRFPCDEHNSIPMQAYPLLVVTPQYRLLIDTGLGNKLDDRQRRIYRLEEEWAIDEDLAALGMTTDDIDFVICTHLDWDHAGGGTRRLAGDGHAGGGDASDGHAGGGDASDGHAGGGDASDGHAGDGDASDGHAGDGDASDGQAGEGRASNVRPDDERAGDQQAGGQIVPTFGRARYVVQRAEWEAALNPTSRTQHGYWRENWAPLLDAKQVDIVEGDAELVPGVHLHLSGGHTHGHQVVRIESGGETVLHLGDILPTHAHLNPLWVMGYDNFPLTSIAEKERWLPQAQAGGWWLTFYHDPFLLAATIGSDGTVERRVEGVLGWPPTLSEAG